MKERPMNIDAGRYWNKAWQLVDGCTPVSAGCDNCWSAAMSHRFKKGLTNGGKFNGAIKIREDNLELPLKTRKPTVFAVWNDLFHENSSTIFINKALDVMVACPQHIFLVLTKRANLIANKMYGDTIDGGFWDGCREFGDRDHLPYHIYFGVSVENQQTADERIPHLLQIPGFKKFLSIEPMLGKINLKLKERWCFEEEIAHDCNIKADHISQVICGGETGYNARPCHPDWVRSLRDQCKEAGVPFFFKNLGIWLPSLDVPSGYADTYCYKRHGSRNPCLAVDNEVMVKVGKKATGRILDGRTHDELAWVKK